MSSALSSTATRISTGKLPQTSQDEGRRYMQGHVIGRGGLGTVYAGWDLELNRRVAMKRIRSTQSSMPCKPMELRKEARTLASLSHPNLPAVHDYTTDPMGDVMVMEFVEGRTVDTIVRYEPMALDPFLAFAKQCLSALGSIHTASLIHNDVKPENILVWEDPAGNTQVKLLDMGCARSTGTRDTSDIFLGSPPYVSPEVLMSQCCDERSDIYSLGLVFYYALSARDAFEGKDSQSIARMRLHSPAPPLAALRPDLPASILRWIHSMIELDPARRPANTKDASAALDYALADIRKKQLFNTAASWCGIGVTFTTIIALALAFLIR